MSVAQPLHGQRSFWRLHGAKRSAVPGPNTLTARFARQQILTYLIRASQGATDAELAAMFRLSIGTIRVRRGELVKSNHLVASLELRDGATVWIHRGRQSQLDRTFLTREGVLYDD